MVRVLVAIAFFVGVYPFAGVPSDWEKTQSIAASQHEIIMLLIKNREYDKLMSASRKILALDFPEGQEHRLVQHAQEVNSCLIRDGQYNLAQQLLDETLKSVHVNKSKAELYKEKAYAFKKEGRDKDALLWFEKAVQVEESTP